MRKLLLCLGAALLLVLPQGKSATAPLPNQEKKELKKHQKEQRKMVKQQQRAMKKVMAQHEQSGESQERFKHNMKMQRQIVRKSQKDEIRRQKENRKSARHFHSQS